MKLAGIPLDKLAYSVRTGWVGHYFLGDGFSAMIVLDWLAPGEPPRETMMVTNHDFARAPSPEENDYAS